MIHNSRSDLMKRIRSKDTQPELKVRKFLHQSGFRFRLHKKELPGKPDIVLKKYRSVIFVNGCFWHGHSICNVGHSPKSNQSYWTPKIEGNIARDKKNQDALKKLGWIVYVIWECELKYNLEHTLNKLLAHLTRTSI